MTIRATVDTSEWDAALENLAGPLREHLARSMAVAAGKVFRDEAKVLAPRETGRLASSIYLVYADRRSTDERVIYSVSWNAKTAPHGHLLEFGHWQPYRVAKLASGEYVTIKSEPLANPKWIPARPFLRPALDTAGSLAMQAAMKRGRERLPELLRGEA